MTSTSREALVVFAENVENVNKAVDNMNSSLARHSDLVNANSEIKAVDSLSNAIKSNDKTLMINLSKEISNLLMGYQNQLRMNPANLLNQLQNQT